MALYSVKSGTYFKDIYPDAVDPYYHKWNYTTDFEIDRRTCPKHCNECAVQQEHSLEYAAPHIGQYHLEGRYFNRLPPGKFHKQQWCSRALQQQLDTFDHQRKLDQFGISWDVPWMKYKSKRYYGKPVKQWSIHEAMPHHPAKFTYDKMSTTVFETPLGLTRFSGPLLRDNCRRIRSAWYEIQHPHWMYNPPNWYKIQF